MDKLYKVIDWEMFNILILQKYYNLPDEQTECQIKDRLSFMQFLRSQTGDNVPDEKTIWLLKEQLKKKKLSKERFTLFTGQFLGQGIIAKEGSIVDVSFVHVRRKHNTREENADIKKGAIPLEFAKKDKNGNFSKLSQKDTDASWMTKGGEKHFVYKDQVNINNKTKLITNYSVSGVSPHYFTEPENLIDVTDD